MKINEDKLQTRKPIPVIKVANDSTVLYSNEIGDLILHDWKTKVGEKLPLTIDEIVQRVISQNYPEKMEIRNGNIYSISLNYFPEDECVNIYRFDVSGQKELEEKVMGGEDKEVNIELGDVIDINSLQSLIDDFYKLSHIPMSLDDLKGNVLVGVGWQEICIKFHRVHPATCKHCIESSTRLSVGIPSGEFKLFKCKNNMWDMATPIIVGGQHVGNIFSGQFFFEDEPLDYEFFRSQARKYGFNEKEYLAALEKVPRMSRESIDTGFSYLMKLANMISQLSYSNTMLAKSLTERDAILAALQETEKRERARSEELAVVLDATPVAMMIAHDPQALKMTGNRLSYEWIRVPKDTNISKAFPEEKRPETHKLFKDGVEVSLENMPLRIAASGEEVSDYELDVIYPDGTKRHVLCNSKPLFDDHGKPRGAVAALIDITERKQAEEALKKAYDSLEEKVKERTEELEKAYNSLKESEKSLAEAQRMAHIGNIDWNLVTGEVYWSDEMYNIFKRDPQKPGANYKEFLSILHPDDRNMINNAIKKAQQGESVAGDYSIILANGEERKIYSHLEVINNEKNIPFRIKGTFQDITELKKSEEEIRKLANIVESSYDAIGTIALNGNITNWNKSAEKIYGYSAEEILGKSTSIMAPAHLKDETKILTEKIKQGESIDHHETVRLRKDGRIIDVSITLSPVLDSHGKLTAISFISRDMSERKKIEEKLRENEEKYRNIVETINEGISINNGESIITYVNQKMAKMLGYTTNEIIGRNMFDFVEAVDESIILKNMQNDSPDTMESYDFKLICNDGSPLWVFINSKHLFDEYGKFIGSLNIYTDITERKKAEEKLRESEEKYRNIVETANEGILIIDNEALVIYANNKLAAMSGYNLEEIYGRSICDFLAKESKAIVKLNLKNRRLGIDSSYEFQISCKDGSPLWVLSNAKSLFNKNGEFIGTLSMLTDITKRKETEQALANFEIAREKEIHHRIKNNLQVVYSMLDFNVFKFKGRNDIKDSEVIDSFRESKNRVRSMALIHEELYKNSELETINFSAYVEKLTNNLLLIYRTANLDVKFKKDIKEDIFFDMNTIIPLGTMINEIVSNSLKYAFHGRDKGEIQIEIHREKNWENIKDITENSKNTTFVLTVSDNGIGIPENLNIEELDSLGLHLVTALVNQLGGELKLKRRNGTEFTIRFTVIEKDKKTQKAAQ